MIYYWSQKDLNSLCLCNNEGIAYLAVNIKCKLAPLGRVTFYDCEITVISIVADGKFGAFVSNMKQVIPSWFIFPEKGTMKLQFTFHLKCCSPSC